MKRLADQVNVKAAHERCRPARFGNGGRLWMPICVALAAAGPGAALCATETRSSDISRLSIEELIDVEITSVSKRPELLSNAAASVYVITREDIRRSGANSIPEILRLAPNLQVARVDASQYAITARGFNNTLANKLLVLIDGRSVYTPLYSGVFWDVQSVPPENIERIEVISGPGGTLWGANAVNGVINIITRDSHDTLGTMVSMGAGNVRRGASARYGGQLNENATYRIDASGFTRDHTMNAAGADAQDRWGQGQMGFRMDWGRSADTLMLEGRAYNGSIDQIGNEDKSVSGAHVLARWARNLGNASGIELQAYYDKTKRTYPGVFNETLDVYNVDLQHRFRWGVNHDIVWGGGYRLARDDVTNSATTAFLPGRKDLTLGNVFFQDSISLSKNWQLTLGSKFEHNNYTGMEVEPNVRLAWKLSDNALLWSAVSRSVRTPSRIDTDFYLKNGNTVVLAGGPDFRSEKINSFELGYRAQPASDLSFSISTFYNVYNELRSLEPAPGTTFPYIIANNMEGNGYGAEMWGNYRVNSWWRLSAGYNYLKQRLRLKPGSSNLASTRTEGNDPPYQFALRSSMNLPHNMEFDVALRMVGGLPDPSVPSYTALDMRLGWIVSKSMEISLSGFNLLDQRHIEFGRVPLASEIERSFYLKTTWKF